MIKYIILILLIVPLPVSADDWDEVDTSLQVAYSVVHLIDWNQTLQIAEYADNHKRCEKDTFGFRSAVAGCESYEENIYEGNLFLGKRPSKSSVNKYFAGTLIGHYLVSKWLDKPYRNIWQSVWIGIELGYVNHNRKNGFQISLNF